MLNFLLGLYLAGMLLRGWLRGFVREALDLVGLLAGLWVAIKLSGPFGDFLTKSFGVTPEVARIGAGIGLFLLFGLAMSVAAHYLSKLMRLPGLNLINRLGGSAVAVAWGVALLVVIVNVARVLPLPDDWEGELDDSTVVEAFAGPDAFPQRAFDTLTGDNVLGALASIQDIFGSSRAVPEGEDVLAIPPADSDEIRQVREEAEDIVGELNELRAGRGLRPLVVSDALTALAETEAEEAYTSGRLARTTPDCVSRVNQATELRVARCGEGLALAGTALAAFDGVVDSDTGETELTAVGYDRTGVAVVDGPTGRLLVIVLAG